MSAENEMEMVMDVPVAQDVESEVAEVAEAHEELTLEAVLTFTESLEAHDLVQLMERATDTLKKKLKTTKMKKVLNRPKRPDSIALQMTRAWIPYVLRHSMDNGWESFSITRTVKDKETGEETKEVEIRSGSIPNEEGYTFKDTKTGEQITPAFIFEDTKKHMIFKDAMSLSSKLKYTDETKTTESELYQTFKSEFVPPSASASSEDDGESTTSSTSSSPRVVTRTAAEKAEEKARKAAEKAEEKERKRLEKEEEKARKAAEKEEEKERKRLEKEAAKAAKAAAKVVPIPKAAPKAASAADSKAATAAVAKPATAAAKPTTPTKPVAPAKAATAADSKAAAPKATPAKAATAADSKAATAADSKAATAATASTTDPKAAAKPAASATAASATVAKKAVKAAPKKVEEWTIPNDGNVHPWTFKGVKYAVNYERHVWKMTEDEDLGDWVGLYVPEEDRIDETVPEPEYDE